LLVHPLGRSSASSQRNVGKIGTQLSSNSESS
jgi:hypothetical protein